MTREGLLHRALVVRTCGRHGASARGFNRSITSAFCEAGDDEGREMAADYLSGRTPDAFRVFSRAAGTQFSEIHVWEVEVSNPLSSDKLDYYASLWFGLDCETFKLRLFGVDRYGREHEYNLPELYYSRIDGPTLTPALLAEILRHMRHY